MHLAVVRRLFVVSIVWALSHADAASAQIPPSIEFRVPKPPTVAIASTGGFVAYELHVTNLTATAENLTRVEVLDAASGAVLTSVADSTLRRETARLGPNVPAAERLRIGGGLRAVVYLWFPIDPARPPANLRHRLTLERDSSGMKSVLEGAITPVAPAGPPIGAPLRGEWAALNGPSQASGHRRLVLGLNGSVASGQRFAIDFLQVGEDHSTFTGDRTKNESYHAYGEEMYAVADGVVVETKDGLPENVPGGRAVAIDLETVAGNHIVIDIGGGRYAFYAHVIPGSLRVKTGDRVKRGQVLALVGNSGNSTEPHLHFHIVDSVAEGTSTLGAEGLPYGIEQFELLGSCTLGAAISCERAAAVLVRRGIPLQNQIVRFAR